MKIIDNTSQLLGDDLKATIGKGSRLKIAASCFSIYAFEALKSELSKVESLQFIFTSPTFVPTEVTDRLRKERREFFIPKSGGESSLYGTEFEIQLRNKLTQRAVARECSDWIRKKARFKSNSTNSPMQQFVHVAADGGIPGLGLFHLVERQHRMGIGAASAHLGGDPDRFHDLGFARLMPQCRLRVTLDAIGALGDMGDGDGDQLLGLCIQGAIGEHSPAEHLERLFSVRRQRLAALCQRMGVRRV